MRSIAILFAIILISTSPLAIHANENATETAPTERNPHVLYIDGPGALKNALASHALVVVEFFAPWCGPCKDLDPAWSETAEYFRKNSSADVIFAKCDGSAPASRHLVDKYKVLGFPSVKIFKRGADPDKPEEYTGYRDVATMISYFERKAIPTDPLLSTKEELDVFYKNAQDVAVVAFIPEPSPKKKKAKEGSSNATATSSPSQTFATVAELFFDDVSFAHVTDYSLLFGKKCKGTDCDSPVAVMTKKRETKKHPASLYQGEFSEDLLTTWVDSHAAPLVARNNPDNNAMMKGFQRSFQVPLPQFIIIFEKEENITDAVMDALAVAAEANDDIKFFVGSEEKSVLISRYLGSPPDARYPLFFIHHYPTRTKHLKQGASIANHLPEFLEEYKKGGLKMYVKSEDPKDVEEDGDVTVVTAKTYGEKLLLPNKSVFLFVYAPTCPHSKLLTPTWRKLAKKFAPNPDVIIAKMDGTKNDLNDVRINLTRYPGVFWIPKSGLAVVEYQEARDLKALSTFVKEKLKEEVGDAEDEYEDVIEEVPDEEIEVELGVGGQKKHDEL